MLRTVAIVIPVYIILVAVTELLHRRRRQRQVCLNLLRKIMLQDSSTYSFKVRWWAEAWPWRCRLCTTRLQSMKERRVRSRSSMSLAFSSSLAINPGVLAAIQYWSLNERLSFRCDVPADMEDDLTVTIGIASEQRCLHLYIVVVAYLTAASSFLSRPLYVRYQHLYP